MEMGGRILCGWPSGEYFPHALHLFLSLVGTALLSVMPSVPCDHVPITAPSISVPALLPTSATFLTAPTPGVQAPPPPMPRALGSLPGSTQRLPMSQGRHPRRGTCSTA